MLVKLSQLDSFPTPDLTDTLEDVHCPDCDKELLVGDYVVWGRCFECAKKQKKYPNILY